MTNCIFFETFSAYEILTKNGIIMKLKSENVAQFSSRGMKGLCFV